MKRILVLFGLMMLTACQSVSSGALKPISARDLTEEYERSSTGVRRKYDGKEITVSGYTPVAATLPRAGEEGSVALQEKGDPIRPVTCWFSKDQATEFSRLKGGQYVTVKGVFNGEAGAELKFCKLVKVE